MSDDWKSQWSWWKTKLSCLNFCKYGAEEDGGDYTYDEEYDIALQIFFHG